MANGNLCHDLMALYFWAGERRPWSVVYTTIQLTSVVESSAKTKGFRLYQGGYHLLMKDDIIEIDTNATVTPITIPARGTPSSDSLAMTMLERKRLYVDNG